MNLKKQEFSKWLLVQESVLIWIISLAFIVLAFYCISLGYTGTLPWLAAMVSFPWAAYGVSQMFYYRKSMAENTKDGIKYESAILELQKMASQYENNMGYTVDFMAADLTPYVSTTNVDDYQI